MKNAPILILDDSTSAVDTKTDAAIRKAFAEEIPDTIKTTLQGFADGDERQVTLSRLFRCLSQWCEQSNKKIVLLIDEVDSASNNQVFLDFYAQLRGY